MNEMTAIFKRWLLANYTSVKRFTFWKVSAKMCNFRVPVYKGVPLPWMKWHPSFNDDCWLKCTNVKSLTFWKVSANLYNLRVWIFKVVPFLWMKWCSSFHDDCRPTIRVWKVSLSEKRVLSYTTWGFPFIWGFPFHEWVETRRLTIIGGHEKFRFLKSEY